VAGIPFSHLRTIQFAAPVYDCQSGVFELRSRGYNFIAGGFRMNLPDAPIAQAGFFVTHFFTVKD